MNYITIGREFGSRGREIGKLIGEKLSIPCYDKEFIDVVAEKSGANAKFIETLDEKGFAKFFNSIIINNIPIGTQVPNYYKIPMNDQLFILQSDLLKELSKRGNCIFVGRCADFLLSKCDILSVFIHAPIEKRIEYIIGKYKITLYEAKNLVKKIDKKRKEYYNHYTSKKWGNADSYHLSVDSSKFSIESIADIIIEAYKK